MKTKALTASLIFAAVAHLLFISCNTKTKFQVHPPEDSIPLPFPAFTFEYTDTALQEGYFLVAAFHTEKDAPKNSSSVYIIDHKGGIVWCKPNTNWSNFQLHPNGWMSYFADRKYYFINPDFKVVDSVACVNGAETDAHELLWQPETRHYFLIGIRTDTVDCSAMRAPRGSAWRGSKKTVVKYGVIQELDEKKQLVWEWNSQGHFLAENMDPTFLTNPAKLDIPHFNSIDMDTAGNLLVSARYTNELICLNPKTDSIEWRLGGKRSDFTFPNESLPFVGQHQACWLKNGNVLLYDNGYSDSTVSHVSRSVEYKLDLEKKTAISVWMWSYPEDMVAESTGGNQRLERGKTLINFGKLLNRKPNVMFALVSSTDSVLLKCSFADTLASYRVYYYPRLWMDFKYPQTDTYWENGQYYIGCPGDSGVLWSNGIVGNGLYIHQAGTYQWFRKNPDGSYTGSLPIMYTDQMLHPEKYPRDDAE